MPTPIPFAVAAAQRTGTVDTGTVSVPAGYSTIYFELNIPTTAEYEDAANGFAISVFVKRPGDADFSEYAAAGWRGGQVVGKNGVIDPVPAFQWSVAGLPANTSLFVRVVVTGTYTIGIANGLIS